MLFHVFNQEIDSPLYLRILLNPVRDTITRVHDCRMIAPSESDGDFGKRETGQRTAEIHAGLSRDNELFGPLGGFQVRDFDAVIGCHCF